MRSRTLHVDLHAELHHLENGRQAGSAPCFGRLARFSFNWRDPLQKISKAVGPRDTKPDSARELTKGNLFSDPALRSLGTRRLFCLKVNKPRTSPDRKLGKAILDRGSFTLRNN